MALIEDMANQIAADIKGEFHPTVAIDPATIMAIIGIIVQIAKMYRDCKKSPAQAKDHLAGINDWGGWWTRRKLWNLAKSHVSDHNNPGVSAKEVYEGLLRHAKKVTISDMTQLYLENA